MMRKIPVGLVSLLLILGWVRCLRAQTEAAPADPLTLNAAIDYALSHYPAVRAALEQVNSAKSGVALARKSYLPQLNPVYQANRATQNQVMGIFLPAPIAPSVEGPVQPYSGKSFWDTQAGAFFAWEPVDFGLRRSAVDQARSAEHKSDAEAELTRLQVASATGAYFLNEVSAQQSVAAAQANVERWQVFDKTVQVLVEHELRPGADGSRADAELAMARTQLFKAQGVEQQTQAVLASLMGLAGATLQTESRPLLAAPPADSLPASAPTAHPLALDQQASVEEFRAKQRVLNHTDYPRLFVESEVFARGSGANPDAAYAGGLKGLGFSSANWIAGISLVFPNLFDFSSLREQKRMAQAQEHSQEAKYQQTLQDLTGQIAAAHAAYQSAARIAQNTPVELAAARQTEVQARARYQSGLTNLVEVAEAEGLLAQAERDDALARINVWRALFGVAVAQGNLEPFLAVLRANPEGKP
jgi:outer membrane protein TolC